MLKRITFVVLMLAVCSFAFGADPAVAGKITAVDDGKVTIALDAEKPAWIKKNAPVKFKDGVGKVLEVSPDGVSPVVVTVKTKKAAQMKVDEAITFQKGKAMAGC